MRPAGIRMGMAGAEPASLIGNPWKVALLAGVGPALFLLSLSGLWFRRLGPSFRRARRRQQAFAKARQALAATHARLRGSLQARESPSSEGAAQPGVGSRLAPNAHQAVCTILRHYLADRFAVQADALTPAEAETLLVVQGIPYDLAKRFGVMMQRHFDASFGSSSDATDTGEIQEMLAAIETYHNERPRSRHVRKVALVLLAGLCVSEGVASTPAERSFIWMEALTGLSSAQTPKEFLAVAVTCQKLVDLGVRNADLFYNQGTALLLAEKPSDAVAVLLRAERYGGGAPDISRNLSIAEGRRLGEKMPVKSWLRGILFWHYGLDCTTRIHVAALSFSFLWIAGILVVLGWRRTGKSFMGVAAVVFILFGSSVLATLHQETQIARPASISSTS